jgi:hypothetical protein
LFSDLRRRATLTRYQTGRRRYQGGSDGRQPALTCARRSFRPSVGARREERAVVGSERSLLRQTFVVLVVTGLAAAFATAGPAEGAAPDPAPPSTTRPKPEPAPGAQPTPARTTKVSVQPKAVQPVAPTAPPPPSPPATPPPAPQAVVTPPLVYRRAPVRVQRQKTERKQNPARRKVSKPTLPRARSEVVTDPSSGDRMLLIGGLALVVLIIGDTVFLSLSARFLRA